MATKIKLPKKYENEAGKYPQHKGKDKISYSQYTSWKDPEYQPDYIVQYFSGIKMPSGCFADFGSECGEFIECLANGKEFNETKYITDNCRGIMQEKLDYPVESVYEDEIVIDMDDMVVQAFTDRTEYLSETVVGLLDYKTGNAAKKTEFYSGDEYGQTTLYCYGKIQEGKEIAYSKVLLLDRKGNNTEKHPLRLSGEIVEISTPYSEEKAQSVLKDIRKAAEEISDCYKTFEKYFSKS